MKYFDEKQKRMAVIFIAMLLFGMLASCSNASSAIIDPSVTSIRVVMDNNYPPYIFLDEQGTPQGILVDQWALWEKHTGVKVELSAIPWEDALNGMKDGKFDVIDTIFHTADRAKIYDFTDSYARIDVPIFFHNNISGIADAGDLRGFRVAVKSGDTDAEYLTEAGIKNLVYYNSYEEIIRAAERKEETIFVIDQPPGLYFLYKYGLQSQFNHSGPLFSGEFHRAVKKGDSALLELVTSGFAGISKSEYQAIDNRWFGIQQNNNWREYLPYLLAAILIIMVVILTLSIFARTLQKRVSQRTQELKQALSSLQKSERRYREIFNTTTEAIFIHAVPDGQLLHVNESMLHMYGYASEEEALSENTDDMNVNEPPYSSLDAREKMRKALEEGPQVFEWLAKKKTGELFWAEVSLRSSQIGGESQILSVVRDISERKQAEEALRESESLLREAQVVANMGSYVLDVTTGMWKSSAILDKLFGIDDTYIRSVEGWSGLIHPDHRQQMTDYFTNEVMGRYTHFDREYKIVRKNDKAERWVHGLGNLEFDAQNKLLKMHGVIQDITERKQVEQSLRERERQYRTLVEQIPAIVYIDDVSADMHTIYISPQVEIILGFTPEEWRRKAPGLWEILVHPDDFQWVNAKYMDCAKNGEPFEAEYRMRTADGRFLWLRDQAIMLRDENGAPQLIHGVIHDITEYKQVENEMRQRVMELEMLYESGLAINQLLYPGDIGQKVIELLEQKLGWHHTSIRLYHPQDESLELLAFNQPDLKNEAQRREVGERFKTLIARSSQGLSGWAVQHGQLVRSNNLLNDARYVDTYPGLKSGLYVPMKLGERVVGVISIESEQLNAFNSADERLAATLANQAASALENARLFEAERKQRQVSDALRDALSAGASMSVSLDFETILDRLLEALERVVPFDGGCIMFVQPENLKSTIARMRGYKKVGRQNFENIIKLGFEIASVENLRWMFENKQPLVISDIEQFPGWIHTPETSFIRSWAGAPIIVNNEVIAFFSLDSAEPNFFTNEQAELMRAFTGQASLALQNARLFEQTEHRFREFAALYETSKALSADNDLTSLIKNIVEHAAALLNTVTGVMYLYNRTNDNLEIAFTTTSAVPIGTTLRLGEGMAGRVVQTHQPMRIKDYSTWEGRSHTYEGVLFRAVLEVPMLFGGDLIGVLNVAEMDDSNRTFTESDERLLSLFAAQAAGAIHSASLREETARRAREFASLYETSNALSAENELGTMLRVIVEHARKLLGASSGGMYLYLPDTKELELTVDSTHSTPLGTCLQLGEGAAGYVAQTYQPLRIDDYSTWEGRSPVFEGVSIHAALEVPMLNGGKLIGVLTAEEIGDSTRKFTEADERLLSLFAAQAAGAIHSARLREETARRALEFASLYETSNALSSENELNTMLQVIVEHAKKLLGSSSSGMYLYLAETNELELTVDTTYTPLGLRLKLSEGVAGRVAQTRQPLRVDDYSTWEGRSPVYDSALTRAVLEVPMLYGGELIGVLTADEIGDSTRKFTEADEHLLSLLASQAAGAIHSARLREQTARRLNQLQALHTIDRAISSSFDLHPILNTVLSQTISQLGVDAADILLYHPHLQTLDYVAGQGFYTRAIEQTHLRLGECFAGRAAFERRTIHASNLPEAGSIFTRAAMLKGEGFIDFYAVPLIAKGEVKGVLEVFHRTPLPLNLEWLDFLETLAGQAAITIDQTQLFDDLQRANFELITAYDATIEGWARAMDLRDKETESHTRRVTELTIVLAKALGIKDSEILHIRRGALLHDIGKMGVPDNILLKEGELTNEEWDLMHRHPQFAYEMLRPIKYLRQSLDIPYCHHEKWDGTGYPRGLKGEQIPLAARIFAVIDVWDAVTIDRPYRKGWTKKKALSYIKEQSGKHFEPEIVDVFLEMFGSEP